MTKREKVMAGSGALLIAAALVAGVAAGRSPASALSNTVTSGSPADQMWSWTIEVPGDARPESGFELRVRSRSSPRGEHESVRIRPAWAPMTVSEAQHEFGLGAILIGAAGVRRGAVSIQLLDLPRIGATSNEAGHDLRFLAHLAIGGTRADANGKEIMVATGRIAGSSYMMNQEQWVNHELSLMNFYTQGAGWSTEYDVFLVEAVGEKAMDGLKDGRNF